MSLVVNYVKGVRGLKLKDLMPFTKKYASEHLQPATLRHKAESGMNQYKRDYIDTGSPKPLYDVLIYGFIGAYILAWPQEYAHYKHEQEAKLHGHHDVKDEIGSSAPGSTA